MRVYIAGPITHGHRTANIRRAIEAGERIAVRGHRVFIPHMNELWEFLFPHDHEFWMKNDIAWLRQSEIVVRIFGLSEGADREVGLAKQWGIPVFDSVVAFMHSEFWCRTDD